MVKQFNKTYSSYDIAKAMIGCMAMANFGGFIKQEDSGPLLQLSPGDIKYSDEDAQFSLGFGDDLFVVKIQLADNIEK